ncbi:SAVED domain-containing protein [Rhizobium sp. LjRoot98]|uniref:HamA C-terminal domain-containing protein n=1 Tax=Rhizobium sp. LjRoot98 TaxID=3342345 RepID=UPI003ED015AC
MSLTPLIHPSGASDAGGVAGRRGFKFQDHIAARFLLQLLDNPALQQVECETGDDIALRWRYDSSTVNEYVQVKITDGDAKWSLGEICDRSPKTIVGTSLIEKSLACDAFPGVAQFRIISRRDVRKDLQPLKVERGNRASTSVVQDLTDLGTRLEKRLRGVVSPQGTTVPVWTHALLWEHVGEFDAVKQDNINRILRLAEAKGECIYISVAEAIYAELLNIAIDAGDASRVSNPTAKAITKTAIQAWWKRKVAEIREKNRSAFKVYQFATTEFFAELHRIDESPSSRSMASYDAEFDNRIWRGRELAEYLINWIPEVSLPARVLAKHTIFEARELIGKAVEAIGQYGINYDELLSQLLLHALLRHYHASEPIACKLFSVSSSSSSSVNAHIVYRPEGDELWLGQAHVTSTRTWNEVLAATSADLEALVDRDFLRKERDLILQLREPQHMLATTLEKALTRHAKLDDLVKILNLPILVAYDSGVLAAGFQDNYVDELKKEAIASYENLKASLSNKLIDIRIHVFLIPIQDAANFASVFKKALDACHGN